MKNTILTVATLLMISLNSFSAPKKSKGKFERYIAKQIYSNSSFVTEGHQGIVKLKLKLSDTGIVEVNVVSGVNEKVDKQIAELVKNVPAEYLEEVLEEHVHNIIVPVKLVIAE